MPTAQAQLRVRVVRAAENVSIAVAWTSTIDISW